MKVKKDSFYATDAQQFAGDPADFFLLRNFGIGKINAQQATVNQTMKFRERQTGNALLSLPIKVN